MASSEASTSTNAGSRPLHLASLSGKSGGSRMSRRTPASQFSLRITAVSNGSKLLFEGSARAWSIGDCVFRSVRAFD